MEWRLIELETYNGPMNMAIDEAILYAVENNIAPPTIRFYKWNPGCISLGYRQTISDINQEFCKELGIDIVRRITGGRAVYHDTTDLTYSLVVQESFFNVPKRQLIKFSHNYICGHIIDALETIGINGSLYTMNDIRVNSKKISGSAQNPIPISGRKVVLQHGTLLLNYNENLMRKLINDSESGQTISIHNLTKTSDSIIYKTLKNSFVKNKDYKIGSLTQEEFDIAQNLVQTKYNIELWNSSEGSVSKGSCYQRPGNI